jgi:hypothetical protein
MRMVEYAYQVALKAERSWPGRKANEIEEEAQT